jgi:hypothetical protein
MNMMKDIGPGNVPWPVAKKEEISNQQGGGPDISSFSGKKPGSEGNFRKV